MSDTMRDETVDQKRILLVDDDPALSTLVSAILEHDGKKVDVADTAARGSKLALENYYDLIILDLGLPDGNGYDICSSLRQQDIITPVLILTGEHDSEVMVSCLKSGADDYLTKPFDGEELLARIEAITRRSNLRQEERTLRCGNMRVDLIDRKMYYGENEVPLTNNEFSLLVYLMKNQNRVISQDELAKKVWGITFDTQTNYINVYISYLRKKIRRNTSDLYIETVRRKGFVFRCPPIPSVEGFDEEEQAEG